MDTQTVERYRQIIKAVLAEYASIPYSVQPELKSETIFDCESDRYLLATVGWDTVNGKRKRSHYIVFHLDIIDGKIYVQADNTDAVIVEDLERAGVPRSDIVLAFHEPEMRQYTGYAVE